MSSECSRHCEATIFSRIGRLADSGPGRSSGRVARAAAWGSTCLAHDDRDPAARAPGRDRRRREPDRRTAAAVARACSTRRRARVRPPAAIDRAARRPISPSSSCARERTGRDRSRSRATGAIAVFGSVAIQGATAICSAVSTGSAHELNAALGCGCRRPGAVQLARDDAVHGVHAATLARLPGVRAVRYLSGLHSWTRRSTCMGARASTRRCRSRSRPASWCGASPAWPSARLRAGGWVVVSQAIAAEHHLRSGSRSRCPPPRPTTLPIRGDRAPTSAGPPGRSCSTRDDYARAWASSDPSAYQVELRAGHIGARHAIHEIRACAGTALWA